MRLTASKSSGNFPPPPIPGDELLAPITSWEAMYAETRVTGVEFEQFWFESVQEGAAYFFSWLGDPRTTVLIVWTDDGPTHIECRTLGDQEVAGDESRSIVAAVTLQFRNAGYWPYLETH
ncbi:MAG: hypothetical protein WBJ68_12270 [Candidatus Dechloromonas phosphoritropha]|jgi:hypothetical protein